MKWQYKVVELKLGTFGSGLKIDDWEEELNDFAKKGWELVSVAPTAGNDGSTQRLIAFLKKGKK